MKNAEPRIFGLVVFILMGLAMISCSKKEDEKIPADSTLPITEITNTTAKGGGTLINENFDNLAFFGLVIDTLPEPTTERKLIMTGGEAGMGFFTVDISGLKPHTRYYARAYATNKVGVGYGQDVEFVSQVEVGDHVQGGVVSVYYKGYWKTEPLIRMSPLISINNLPGQTLTRNKETDPLEEDFKCEYIKILTYDTHKNPFHPHWPLILATILDDYNELFYSRNYAIGCFATYYPEIEEQFELEYSAEYEYNSHGYPYRRSIHRILDYH